MAGEWPTTWKRARLGEVADVNWGDTSVTKASYVETGFRAYSASGPDGFLPYADFDRVGVVLSAIGADCGKTWLAKGKWSCIKNTLRFWSVSPEVDTEFLYWLTHEPSVWPKRGSAQPFISQADARALEIAYPPLPEQHAIAHILGTLDDKIELNRRMSQTLEAMARALFKAWFVDFEPVRAKMEGRWRRGNPLPPLPEGEGRGEGSLPTKSHARLPSDLLAFARELRQNETDAERLLWRLLRNRSLAGAKFRRQHPFPPYVLDFYCHELKLAIELDGGQHNLPEGRLHDKVRTAKLAEHGIRVLRFWNHEVLRDTESVLEAIYQAIVERQEELRPSPPAPLPAGEGSMVSGLPAHLYDLFPDRLVDSELGEIPEGWRVGTIGDCCIQIQNGGTPSRKEPRFWEGGTIPWLTSAEVKQPIIVDTENSITEAGLEASSAKWVAPLSTVVALYGATAGQVSLVALRLTTNQAVCALVPKQYCEFFNYLWMRSATPDLENQAVGSAQQNISQGVVARTRVLIPSHAVMVAFDKTVRPVFFRWISNLHESRTLAALRDALLPKLISGELRVKDVERFLEERGVC
jgi:type I restriction enzyme S subunit